MENIQFKKERKRLIYIEENEDVHIDFLPNYYYHLMTIILYYCES